MSDRYPVEQLLHKLDILRLTTDASLALAGMRTAVQYVRPGSCVEHVFDQEMHLSAARAGLDEQLTVPDEPFEAAATTRLTARVHIPPKVLCHHGELARFSTTSGTITSSRASDNDRFRVVEVATIESATYLQHKPGRGHVTLGQSSTVEIETYHGVMPGESLYSYRPSLHRDIEEQVEPLSPDDGFRALYDTTHKNLREDLGSLLTSGLQVVIAPKYIIDRYPSTTVKILKTRHQRLH